MTQFIIGIVRDACDLTMGYCVAGLVLGNPEAIGRALWALCHPTHWFWRWHHRRAMARLDRIEAQLDRREARLDQEETR